MFKRFFRKLLFFLAIKSFDDKLTISFSENIRVYCVVVIMILSYISTKLKFYELNPIYRFAFVVLVLWFFTEIFYFINLKLYYYSKNKKHYRLKK